MKKEILNIETVHQCNCYLGNNTRHPLASVIDLSKTKPAQYTFQFDFYTVLMIEEQGEPEFFGRKYYDYSNACLLFLPPGNTLHIDGSRMPFHNGRLLAFHPDLLCCTPLGEHLNQYTFFYYQPDESLHLSQREKNKAIECLDNIGQELQHAIDCHSKNLISRHIELFLDYCVRFYDRQFITRYESNKIILEKTDVLLSEYIQSGQLKNGIWPTPAFCANLLHLSPHYFSDLLKFETGKNLSEYFQQKRLEAAREMLLVPGTTVRMIADLLGFRSVQNFSYLFERLTGTSPNEYKIIN